MKKILVFILLNSFIIIACHKKTIPTVKTRSIEPSAPQTEVIDIVPDAATGKTLFASNCNRCHGLPDIPLYSAKRWDIILTSMIPKASLSKEQGIHVTAYIKLNATK
jgi:cytochrome c5